jgi:hypothetical protein
LINRPKLLGGRFFARGSLKANAARADASSFHQKRKVAEGSGEAKNDPAEHASLAVT